LLKVKPHPEYPIEKGRYLRGNDYSPVALAVILNTDEDKIPREINEMVKLGIESGAALSGTIQTPNIGLEKMISNIIANPNIRYLILAGPESAGHLTGDAIVSLFENGIDEKKKVVGTEAQYACLYNIPPAYIERFRKQVSLVNLQFKAVDSIQEAIRACIQEQPAVFNGQTLYDIGAFPEPLLEAEARLNTDKPWLAPADEAEKKAVNKMQEMIERLRKMNKGKS